MVEFKRVTTGLFDVIVNGVTVAIIGNTCGGVSGYGQNIYAVMLPHKNGKLFKKEGTLASCKKYCNRVFDVL